MQNPMEIICSFGIQAVRQMYFISKDFKTISPPEYAAEGITYKELAKAYCRDENFSYIINPKTDEDHWHNVKYAFLTANWDRRVVSSTKRMDSLGKEKSGLV